jgi:hypothetical protein
MYFMRDICVTATLLTLESCNVIWLRIRMLAHGGGDAWDEVRLMLCEKLDAALESGAILAGSGSFVRVLEKYRNRVATNASRLTYQVSR